jgi:hypothetical protein
MYIPILKTTTKATPTPTYVVSNRRDFSNSRDARISRKAGNDRVATDGTPAIVETSGTEGITTTVGTSLTVSMPATAKTLATQQTSINRDTSNRYLCKSGKASNSQYTNNSLLEVVCIFNYQLGRRQQQRRQSEQQDHQHQLGRYQQDASIGKDDSCEAIISMDASNMNEASKP